MHPVAQHTLAGVLGEQLREGLDPLPDPVAVALRLVELGYSREPLVEDRGQFAIRGGLLDLFSATEDRAVRVELFGDEIESLRWFSTFTQRSLGEAQAVEVAPAAELDQEHRELAEIAALEEAAERPDIAELLPVEDFHPFLELAPERAVILVAGEEDLAPALADHWQDVCAAFHDQDAHHLYVAPETIHAALADRARIRLSGLDQNQPSHSMNSQPDSRCTRSKAVRTVSELIASSYVPVNEDRGGSFRPPR